MSINHTRPHVEDIRKMKKRGEKISMLYVTTHDEATAAAAAGICDLFTDEECYNFFKAAGYETD